MAALNNTTMVVTHAESSPADWTFISLQVTGSLIFVIGFPTNLFIMYLVSRRRNLRNPTNYIICSLAAADLMVLSWMLLWIISIHTLLSSVTVRKYIIPSIDISLGAASMVNVACVSTDRVIAVIYPLKYEYIMTKRRALGAIFITWIYYVGLLIAALMRIYFKTLLYNKVILYIGFMSYFVPVIIIVLSYSVILLVIINKLKGIRELERVMSNATMNHHSDKELSERKKRRRRKLLRELKVTGNILLIVVPFTTGWTYFIGTHIYEHVYNVNIVNEIHNVSMIIIPWMLSGLNPVVYLLLNRSLRRALFDTFRKLCRSNNQSLDEGSFFSSFSRRASSALRRASAGIEEGSAGLLNVSKFLQRRRDSKLSSSTPSRSSCDVIKEISMNTTTTVHESEERERSSSVV